MFRKFFDGFKKGLFQTIAYLRLQIFYHSKSASGSNCTVEHFQEKTIHEFEKKETSKLFHKSLPMGSFVFGDDRNCFNDILEERIRDFLWSCCVAHVSNPHLFLPRLEKPER